jgi:DNA-3-methyladenine glycosylase II
MFLLANKDDPGRDKTFTMPISPEVAVKAVRHLRRAVPELRPVIKAVGPFRLKLHRDRFGLLARAIVSQQLSAKAADTINRRIAELVAPEPVGPESLLKLSQPQLRGVGISRQKTGYLLDLAEQVRGGRVRLDRLGRMDDEAVIEELIQVKGIGRWTAQMLLIFSLGRLDVFPGDDLGVLSAIRDLYGLAELPDRKKRAAIAEQWRPYASVASWYCWRRSDLGIHNKKQN